VTLRRAVVTGGAGFIGSHLSDRLHASGVHVVAVDNFAGGRERNIAQLTGKPGFELARIDIREPGALEAVFAGADAVFHLAGLADIVPSIERPTEYFQTNVDGSFQVMQSARAAKVPVVVYAASSSCYGIPDVYPTPESAAISPQYPYALTKYLGERIVMHWGQVYGMRTTSLRLFNVYGPRSRTSGTYGAVFGVFLAQKLAGKPLTVVGDGTQSRDFTFVSDVADAFIAAAKAPAANGKILNVGSRKVQSVNRLAELLGGEVVHIPKRPGEPDMTFADVTAIERTLDWRAKVSFEDGVGAMLERIDDWRDAPVWDPNSIADATKSWFAYLGSSAEPAGKGPTR
jgi:UDP-glucose 4-epimerase